MLEEEIYGANSPIWESGFTMPPSEGTQLVPRPGMCASSLSAWPPWQSSALPWGRGTADGSSGDMHQGIWGSLLGTHHHF